MLVEYLATVAKSFIMVSRYGKIFHYGQVDICCPGHLVDHHLKLIGVDVHEANSSSTILYIQLKRTQKHYDRRCPSFSYGQGIGELK